MKNARQHTFLFAVYILFLAGLVLAYHLVLGAAVAAMAIGLIVGRYDVIEKAGAVANRRLCRLIAAVGGLGLGTYLAFHGDVIGLVVLCLLGALWMVPVGEISQADH